LDRIAKGLKLPEGVAFDAAGKPTIEPNEALDGTLAPFGGHKGAGFALAIELLGSALANGGIAGDPSRPVNPAPAPWVLSPHA
jgi:LDH2 family malate/lactate/ureidoglycolate dehydrogenase